MHRYNWILFDLDNTLIDFSKASVSAFNDLLTHFRVDEGDAAYLYQLFNKGNKQLWQQLEENKISLDLLRLERFKLFLNEITHPSANDPALQLEWHAKYMEGIIKYTTVIADTIPLLESLLSRGIKLAAVTNGLKEAQRPRLIKTKLYHYFDAIVVSDEIGYAKPHLDFFHHTFQEIGQPQKSEVLIVGDSLASDIAGGNQFGIDTCWYNPKQNPITKEHAQPKYNISKLEELWECIYTF